MPPANLAVIGHSESLSAGSQSVISPAGLLIAVVIHKSPAVCVYVYCSFEDAINFTQTNIQVEDKVKIHTFKDLSNVNEKSGIWGSEPPKG